MATRQAAAARETFHMLNRSQFTGTDADLVVAFVALAGGELPEKEMADRFRQHSPWASTGIEIGSQWRLPRSRRFVDNVGGRRRFSSTNMMSTGKLESGLLQIVAMLSILFGRMLSSACRFQLPSLLRIK